MSVLLYHAGVPHCSGGYVGVDAFFVISGFLIIGLLWRELSSTGTVSLRSFYARRARRLLPAAVVGIVATVLASWRVLFPLRSALGARAGLPPALYFVNHPPPRGGAGYPGAGGPP